MAKNYDQEKALASNRVPRKYVIQRILAFSKSYDANKKKVDFFKILKN
jgi:hypothetical protein